LWIRNQKLFFISQEKGFQIIFLNNKKIKIKRAYSQRLAVHEFNHMRAGT
jgi:hypothetical protein